MEKESAQAPNENKPENKIEEVENRDILDTDGKVLDAKELEAKLAAHKNVTKLLHEVEKQKLISMVVIGFTWDEGLFLQAASVSPDSFNMLLDIAKRRVLDSVLK